MRLVEYFMTASSPSNPASPPLSKVGITRNRGGLGFVSFAVIRAIRYCFLSNWPEKVNAGKIKLAESGRECDVSWSGIYGNKEEKT